MWQLSLRLLASSLLPEPVCGNRLHWAWVEPPCQIWSTLVRIASVVLPGPCSCLGFRAAVPSRLPERPRPSALVPAVVTACELGASARSRVSWLTGLRGWWSLSLSMPVRLQQQAHKRRVGGHQSPISVVSHCGWSCCVFVSSRRALLDVPELS